MGMMHEPVEDRVAKGGVAHLLVPVFDRELTRDQRGPTPDAVLDDLAEITPFSIAERRQAPIVQD